MPTNSATNAILTKTFTTFGQSNEGLPQKFVDIFRLKIVFLVIVGTTASYMFDSSSAVDPTIFLTRITTDTVYGLSKFYDLDISQSVHPDTSLSLNRILSLSIIALIYNQPTNIVAYS